MSPLKNIGHLSTPPKVGVLLNANARKVSQRLFHRVRSFLPDQDVFYSHSLEEAEHYFQQAYQKNYDVFLVGGGDGSFLQCLSSFHRLQAQDPTPRKLPLFGILPLGTGNGVGSVIGGDKTISPTLEILQNNPSKVSICPHHFVEVNGKIAPFAGMGLDSLILNSYKELAQRTQGTPFSFFGKGLMGYLNATFMMALPRFAFSKRPEIEIINAGSTAYLLGEKGETVREFQPGEVLFSGPVLIACASTFPFYGFQFTNFPFATSGDKMQLRVANLPIMEGIAHLPSIWNGTYRTPSIQDFHVDKVTFRSKKALPLQIGGDAEGYCQEVTIQKTEKPIMLADLSNARRKRFPALTAASNHS